MKSEETEQMEELFTTPVPSTIRQEMSDDSSDPMETKVN